MADSTHPGVAQRYISAHRRTPLIVEPFAGGGIVSLTAVMERLVDRPLMVDLDRDIAAFWRAALRHGPDLAERVQRFTLSRDRIENLARLAPCDAIEHGFRILLLNRAGAVGCWR